MKQISDYRKLAAERGLEFISPVAPYRVNQSCKWRCLKCGRDINTNYNNLQRADHGCRCQTDSVLPTERYQELAESMNIVWMGDVVPKNTKYTTDWFSRATGTLFKASYADLAYYNPVAVRLRKYVKPREKSSDESSPDS